MFVFISSRVPFRMLAVARERRLVRDFGKWILRLMVELFIDVYRLCREAACESRVIIPRHTDLDLRRLIRLAAFDPLVLLLKFISNEYL